MNEKEKTAQEKPKDPRAASTIFWRLEVISCFLPMFVGVSKNMNTIEEQKKINLFTHEIISAGIEVHRCLGPGLLESIYEECLAIELSRRNLFYERQKPVPVIYKGFNLKEPLRLDIIVEEKIIIELKAVERLAPIHEAQLISYMRLTNHPLGLLINFNSVRFVEGIRRFVFNFDRDLAYIEDDYINNGEGTAYS